MEAYDPARAYPGCLEPIYQGLADAVGRPEADRRGLDEADGSISYSSKIA